MRYLLLLLLIALFVPFVLFRYNDQYRPSSNPILQPSPSPNHNLKNFTFQDQQYRYDVFKITTNNHLKLINNLKEKISSTNTIESQSCKFLVNGGFYAKNFTHIGLLKINGQILSNSQENKLFNGYLSASASGALQITRQPIEAAEDALQSGPILISQSTPNPLKIQNDEPERRLVAITDANQNAYFFIIIGIDSSFVGPTLTQLPGVIMTIAQHENIIPLSAINLDGGSASVFYNGQTHIKEANPVGTYLCFQ